MSSDNFRTCKACNKNLPIERFPITRKPYGIQLYRSWKCKDCKITAERERREITGKTKTPRRLTQPFLDPSGVALKRCSKCRTPKTVNSFHQDKGRPRSYCKECEVERRRASPESTRRAAREYARRHPEYIKAQRQKEREWREANPAEAKSRKRKRYLKNRRYNLEYARRYRETASPERIVILKQQTRRAQIARYARWRAEKLGHSPIIDRVMREEIIARDGPICYLCGKVLSLDRPLRRVDWLTLDHFIPLAKGGHHTAENLRVACQSCNSKKSSKTLDEFRQLYPRICIPA